MRTPRALSLLHIEDNPRDAELTRLALEESRLLRQLTWFRDGVEALEYLLPEGGTEERPHPDLILLDLKLPRVSGLEVLRRLKSDPVSRSIPVVVMTSSNEAPDVEACYDAGANSFVVKPVDFERFGGWIAHIASYWLTVNVPLRP